MKQPHNVFRCLILVI